VPTLADLYDRATGNAAKVGMFAYKSWHLGMVSHGAMFSGGDRDVAIISTQNERQVTNPLYYRLPDYANSVPGLDASIRAVDLDDGKLDDTWMGHEILDDPTARRDTPAWVLYQTRILEALLANEGFGADDVPDLFFTNYKQIDEVGHNWNLVNREMEIIIEYTDEALAELVGFLDQRVGRGKWVLAVTADHGQGPDPRTTGAWPINMSEVRADVGSEYDAHPEDIITDVSPVGYWVDRSQLRAAGATIADLADFFLDYRLQDNVMGDGEVPEGYGTRRDEPIFVAAFPSSQMNRVWRCARGG
jgi:hypothetical protein